MPTEQEIREAYLKGAEQYEKGDFFDQISEWAGRLIGPPTEPLEIAHQAGYDDAVKGTVNR